MAPLSAERTAQSGGGRGLTRWIDENRNLAIALGVGTVVVGGAGAYYYLSGSQSSSSSRRRGKKASSDSGEDAAAAGGAGDEKSGSAAAAAAKKKRKNKKKGAAAGKDGGAGEGGVASGDAILDEANDEDLHNLSEDEIKRLPEEKRRSLAQSLKTAGNKAYTKRHFEDAIQLYTKAIAAHPLAVFYSNRAACRCSRGRVSSAL